TAADQVVHAGPDGAWFDPASAVVTDTVTPGPPASARAAEADHGAGPVAGRQTAADRQAGGHQGPAGDDGPGVRVGVGGLRVEAGEAEGVGAGRDLGARAVDEDDGLVPEHILDPGEAGA